MYYCIVLFICFGWYELLKELFSVLFVMVFFGDLCLGEYKLGEFDEKDFFSVFIWFRCVKVFWSIWELMGFDVLGFVYEFDRRV